MCQVCGRYYRKHTWALRLAGNRCRGWVRPLTNDFLFSVHRVTSSILHSWERRESPPRKPWGGHTQSPLLTKTAQAAGLGFCICLTPGLISCYLTMHGFYRLPPHPLVVCPVLLVPLLKDKRRHIKKVKSLFEQKST